MAKTKKCKSYILFLLISSFVGLAGCTYSIILNHTSGHATDVIDEGQEATPQLNLDGIPDVL